MSDEDPFEELEADPIEDDAVDAEVDDLFTEVTVGDVDEEAVWEALTGDDAPPTVDGDPAAVEGGSAGPGVDDGEGTVVPKASYCQQCEHFSAPPGVDCENPGTDIVELVDMERFRVRDCPVVERRSSATRDIDD